jgi:hypothetical protein
VLRKNLGKKAKTEGRTFRVDVGLEDERASWSGVSKDARPERADWLKDLGYVKWCRMEAVSLNKLLVRIQGSQRVRDKAIDDLLGFGSTVS